MFDIGFGEMVLLAAIALIAIGPKQLPEVARTIGRLLAELKKASSDFTRTLADASGDANATITDVRNSLSKVVEPTIAQLTQLSQPQNTQSNHQPHYGHTPNPDHVPLDQRDSRHYPTYGGPEPVFSDPNQLALSPQPSPIGEPAALDDHKQMTFDLASSPPAVAASEPASEPTGDTPKKES